MAFFPFYFIFIETLIKVESPAFQSHLNLPDKCPNRNSNRFAELNITSIMNMINSMISE
jgi:hypothetical protein